MANMNELAKRLRKANPTNKPMRLSFMARIFWPGRDEAWLNKKVGHNNSGARRGARMAAGLAGKMRAAGLLHRHIEDGRGVSMWLWVKPKS